MSGILIIDNPAADGTRVSPVAGSLELPVGVEFVTGAGALYRLHGELPDVIVIDMSPDGEMDGEAVIRQLRTRAPEALLVACGLFEDAATVSELYELGVDRCLRKPLHNEDLLRLLPKNLAETLPA